MKTGGLADVVGALPAALAKHGVAMKSLVPGYPAVLTALENPTEIYKFDELMGGAATLRSGTAKGLVIFVLDAPHLYNRPGNPYLGADGKDWPWLIPPTDLGPVRCQDILTAPEAARPAKIEVWAESVWQAWAPQHDQVRALWRQRGPQESA